MARVIFNGEPGASWTNGTGRVQYQLLVNWSSTCGVCAQYDHAIGPAWPLPYHRNCRCRQVAIVPGASAEPFVDFLEIARGLDDDGRRALVGASSFRLVAEGVVRWEDVVTPYRVRALHEVVAIKKLTVDRLAAAGVRRDLAEKAWATVHTPEHELVEAHRRKLVAALEGAGLDRGTLAGLAGEALATRVGIGTGPSGPQAFAGGRPEDRIKRFLMAWSPGSARPVPRPPEAGPGGERVGRALRVDDSLKPAVREHVRAAVEAVDRVHGAVEMPEIPIRKPDVERKGEHGAFVYTMGGRPLHIQISKAAPTPRLTTAHEIGHFLDLSAFPKGPTIPGRPDRDFRRDARFAAWLAAVESSAAYRSLAELTGRERIRWTDATGAEFSRPVSQTHVKYLMDPAELWARSYAQYVALRSGDRTMAAELDGAREPGPYAKQWADDDFGPIAKAIDDLFQSLGWRK